MISSNIAQTQQSLFTWAHTSKPTVSAQTVKPGTTAQRQMQMVGAPARPPTDTTFKMKFGAVDLRPSQRNLDSISMSISKPSLVGQKYVTSVSGSKAAVGSNRYVPPKMTMSKDLAPHIPSIPPMSALTQFKPGMMTQFGYFGQNSARVPRSKVVMMAQKDDTNETKSASEIARENRLNKLRTEKKTPKVAASLAKGDFTKLGEELKEVYAAGNDWVHIDVQDGRFVQKMSIGPPVVKALRGLSDEYVLDCHLMMVEPEQRINDFVKAGADIITVHVEGTSTIHIHRCIQMIKEQGCLAGVAILPGTPVDAIQCVLEMVDLVLVMSVNPGFGNQKFIPASLDKVRAIKSMCKDMNVDPWIQIDGQVGFKNCQECIDAGVTSLVTGSAVFGADDKAAAIKKLKGL